MKRTRVKVSNRIFSTLGTLARYQQNTIVQFISGVSKGTKTERTGEAMPGYCEVIIGLCFDITTDFSARTGRSYYSGASCR